MAEGSNTTTLPYQLIPLVDTSFEYKEVWGTVMRTAGRDLGHYFENPVKIIDIKRVQNVVLWEQFCSKRALEMRNGSSAWVMELFYGVKEANVEIICRGDQGGNEAKKPVPFSPYFWYARRFPRRNPKAARFVIMCDVLMYNHQNSNDFAYVNKFDDHEFYPKYVIQYSQQHI